MHTQAQKCNIVCFGIDCITKCYLSDKKTNKHVQLQVAEKKKKSLSVSYSPAFVPPHRSQFPAL